MTIPSSDTDYFRPLLLAILTLTGLRLALLAASSIGFYGDEAQYWSWAQTLDWGYFTKPPMIAYVIGATTSVCGDGAWCARAGSPLLHAATSLTLYALGTVIADRRTGFWAGLLYLTLPAVSFSSAVISTDVPLLLFFALALLAYVKLLTGPSWGWAVLLGAAIGLGLLSKYAMAYFIACAVLHLLFTAEARRALPWRQVAVSLLIALVIFTPNILWNLKSGWATFSHLGDNASLDGEGRMFRPTEVVDFLGEQLGVFGPLLFGVLAWRILRWIRVAPGPTERMLLIFSAPILLAMVVQAFLSRANANWAATAYVAGTLLVAHWAARAGDRPGRMWVAKGSLGLHLVAAAVLALFYLNLPGIEPPVKSDPLRKLRGWDALGGQLTELLERHPDRILLTEDRMIMASMLYVLRDAPAFQGRPFRMWDFDGRMDHHYELTARYQAKAGDKVLLVSNWDRPTPILESFDKTVAMPPLSTPIGAGKTRELAIYLLDDPREPIQ